MKSSVLFEVQLFEVQSFNVGSFKVVSFEVQSFEVGSFEVQSYKVQSFKVQSFEVQSVNRTKAYYKCVKKDSAKCPAMAVLHIASSKIVAVMHEHVHEPNILHETARTEEKRMIAAAALVGRVSIVEVMSKIKTNLERSDIPEAKSSMRKSKALSMAINREKKKTIGHSGTIPKTTADIIDNLPERFKTTSTGTPFLRYMDYVDGEQSKLMLIFMSDHGAWVLGRSSHNYSDGTFDTCPVPFSQLYFIMGRMDDTKRAVPSVYALLPDKDGTTYLKMWNQIKALVTFQDGLPPSIMSDFQKAVLNTM